MASETLLAPVHNRLLRPLLAADQPQAPAELSPHVPRQRLGYLLHRHFLLERTPRPPHHWITPPR